MLLILHPCMCRSFSHLIDAHYSPAQHPDVLGSAVIKTLHNIKSPLSATGVDEKSSSEEAS